MRASGIRFLLMSAGVAMGGLVMLSGQAPGGPFTAAQAAAGRTAYQANCASCHLPDLKGSGDAAQLAGSEFMDAWGRRTTREFLSFMQLTMPPTRPGALSQEEYLNIAAFVLQSNGALPGNAALTPQVDVAINSVPRGQAPAVAAAAPPGRGAPPAAAQAAGGRGRAAGPPAGITVDGEVKNYVPVTEAMLRNPDPADWLMIRRDYHASDYSPLNQITADNVKDLRLQWIWAMNEGGANQPAPLVHNGVIFLNNPGNVLQAIDGKTGELIWENRYGSNANGAAMRGISLYEDKIFVATSEAHLMAFDAKTGKNLWHFQTGNSLYAGAITYMLDGRQYVLMPSGTALTAFALADF